MGRLHAGARDWTGTQRWKTDCRVDRKDTQSFWERKGSPAGWQQDPWQVRGCGSPSHRAEMLSLRDHCGCTGGSVGVLSTPHSGGNYFRESEMNLASGYCSPVISLYKQWLRITVRRASVNSHGEGHHWKGMTCSSLLSWLCTTFSFLPVDMKANFKSCSSSLTSYSHVVLTALTLDDLYSWVFMKPQT